MSAGAKAVAAESDLSGLNGPEAQARAIASISNGPEMAALTQQGENAILQNAAATGGLRGGNTQGALAQFRPQMLSSLIGQQYQRLGGIAGLGQNSAATFGQGAVAAGGQQASLYGQQGASAAGLYGQQGSNAAQLYSGQGQSIAELLAAQGNAQAAAAIAQGQTWSSIPDALTAGLGVLTGGGWGGFSSTPGSNSTTYTNPGHGG